MLYAIMAEEAANSTASRKAAALPHVQRIESLQADGRLVLAGSFPSVDCAEPGSVEFTGSLVVAEFESLEDAQAWVDADPYVIQGVFAKVDVRPFVQNAPK